MTPPRISRRKFLGTTAAMGAGALLPWRPWSAAAPSRLHGFAAEFAAPGSAVRPRFRWWWPHGLVDPVEIGREVDQIAAAGFGGVEIADVHHSAAGPLDPAGHGWGTPAWNAGVEAALERGRDRGVGVDIAIGPAWPPAVPGLTPDAPAAAKELAHGVAVVAGGETYSGPIPGPLLPPRPGVTQSRPIWVQAARVSDGSSPGASPIVLDAGSLEHLTDRVADGQLTWTAPAGGTWLVIGYWERGTGQLPERGPHSEPLAYVVDHFSRAGVDAIIAFWESRLLTARIRHLLGCSGGALFEDSIELESEATLWTSAIPEEFERRRAYRLWDYLPAIVLADGDPVFTLGNADLTGRVRYDLDEVRTELYIERHLEPLRRWGRSIGLLLRIQPAGLATDAIAKAALVDIPEGESLGFRNLDDFRCLAGGRDMGGRELLSCELGAYNGGAYSTGWTRILRTLGGEYAAGMNHAVLHGFSYAEAPGAEWPGFAAFSPYDGAPGFAESWGPRQPTWAHANDIADYMGRTQKVLRSGRSTVDAAVLRQRGLAGTGIGTPYFTAGMGSSPTSDGWTHQILSPRLLDLPAAAVSRRRLAASGPAYKVLVFEGDVFAGRVSTLEIRTAERLLRFARAGLPIIVIGAWSAASVPGVARPGANARLQEVVDQLLAQPSVRLVADRTAVGGALVDLGIEPDVRYSQRSSLLSAHRVDHDADYYYLCNGFHAEASSVQAIEHEVSMFRHHPEAIPYALDAWTGAIERIALYQEDGDRIRIRVKLRPAEATIVALARRGWCAEAAAALHATTSDADELRFVGGDLVVRATRPGTYTTTLADGRIVSTTILDVPAAQTLSAWDLVVEDWQPGPSPTETAKLRRQLTLGALAPWSQIAGLEDVSGIGRYTTTVELAAGWAEGYGAHLDLGEVFDTVRVAVNGRRLPAVDQINRIVDIGPYLVAGPNAIEVEVATTLLNRLRVANPRVFGAAPRQRYGLIGPVRLIPYGQAPIDQALEGSREESR